MVAAVFLQVIEITMYHQLCDRVFDEEFVGTATGAIDVAAELIGGVVLVNILCIIVGTVVLVAYHTAVDVDVGVLLDMAVLTAAIDGALDLGRRHIVGGSGVANGDLGSVGPGHGVLTCQDGVDVASRGAVDHTVLVAVVTDDAAGDIYRGKTGARGAGDYLLALGRFVDGAIGEGADGSQGAAAVDVVPHAAASDIDGGVALDETCRYLGGVAETSTVDVAVGGSGALDTDGTGGDIHLGVAIGDGDTAAAVDAALDMEVGAGHVDLGIGSYLAGVVIVDDAKTAAVDLMVDMAVQEVHNGACDGGSGGGDKRKSAAAEDIVDIQAASGDLVGVDVDGNGIGDDTIEVTATEGGIYIATIEVEAYFAVDIGSHGSHISGIAVCAFSQRTLRAAEDVFVSAAVEVEGDVTGDGGHIGAAVDFVDIDALTTGDGGREVARDGHLVTAAEEAADIHVAGVAVVDRGAKGTVNGTALVTAAEDSVDETTVDDEVGAAGTDVGGTDFTVTATEDTVEASTVNNGSYAIGGSGIATAEEVFYGVLAAIDVYGGVLGGSGTFVSVK